MAVYSSGDIWSVTGEEKAKHEKTFQTLNPIQGKVSGDQAKRCFMKSNLPSPVLGLIWSLSDIDKDGKMTQQEFVIAMHLIQCKLKGLDMPRILPNNLRSSSEPTNQVFPSSSMYNQPPIIQPMQPMMVMNNSAPMGMVSTNMNMSNIMPPQQIQYGHSGNFMNNTSMTSHMSYGVQPLMPTSQFNTSNSMPPQMYNSAQASSFSSSVSIKSSKISTSKAFDSLSLDSLQGFTNLSTTSSQPKTTPNDSTSLGNISAANRMRYTQMFKAADNIHCGYLQGEQARQILIQSNVNPQLLAQIWDLSDINKDGRLEIDEFLIAMHLIDSSKLGVTLPSSLPSDLIPVHLKNAIGDPLVRSDSTSSKSSNSTDGFVNAASFEDRRKMNWDKGQQELERRRRELQEKQQREKDERERKEREEEERKQRLREEAEQKRLHDLETQRRQKEELLREQEMARKKMIEERQAAQLEAERQRQREWESRRKEELLNQKGLEENIVNELKNRLTKLKAELVSETSTRDTLQNNFDLKKTKGRELHAAIESLKVSSNNQIKDIARLQTELSNSKLHLSALIQQRERYLLELNEKDSTTTSEALGGIRSSIQQMTLGINKLRKTLLNIESETANVLKGASEANQQQKELKVLFEDCLRKNNELKQETNNKRKEMLDTKRAAEINKKKIEVQKVKQEEMRRKLEADLKRKKEMEVEAMYKEQQIQKASQKQRVGVINQRRDVVKQQAEEALKIQQNLLRSQDAQVQKQQDALNKVPPPRPRTRPQGSPTKTAISFDAGVFQPGSLSKKESKLSNADSNIQTFNADFSAFESSNNPESLFNVNFDTKKSTTQEPTKVTPARPTPPRPMPPKKMESDNTNDKKSKADDNKKKEKDTEKKMKEVEKKKKKEEEARKKVEEADKKRLEKEKLEIKRLKKEQELKEQELAKQRQQQEDIQRREDEERLKKERFLQEKFEKEKEEEKQKKDAEVKKRVEEMQRKKMEKKNAASIIPPPEKLASITEPSVGQYVKKVPYKMMYPFEARNHDELSLSEGNIVMVDESDTNGPPGWLRGTFNGNTGLFPANYASKIQNDNFSDYVDLDPRANVAPVDTPVATKKPVTPRPVTKQAEAEAMPKLKPVARPSTKSNANRGSQPKSALMPGGSLKPIQPVVENKGIKQKRVSMSYEENADLFPRYDFVSPITPNDSLPQTDIYAVPNKELIKSVEDNSLSTEQQQGQPIVEDMYQVPGEIIPASDAFHVIALYPYRAKKEDHLSFDKNDTILVRQQQDQWWFGESAGVSGWFPKSYVKTMSGKTPLKLQSSLEIVTPVRESTTNLNQDPVVEEEECIAMFEYVLGQEGDLIFYEGDLIKILSKEGEWWEGECKGKRGMFPANYVQIKEKETAAKNQIEKLPKPELVTVITKYTAAGLEEISLNVGQLVYVFQKNSNGWWEGELQVRGKNKPKGWFPSSNVKLKIKSETPASSNTSQPQQQQQQQQPMQEDIYSVPAKRKEMYDKVLALFSYTAQNDDELTFYKGSVIKVISKDGEWWKGELNDKVGVFPFNYVQDLRSDTNEMTSQWSGSFDVNLLKSMSKTEQQRQNHIYELINTEQDYMNDLSLTLEVFYNPMAEGHVLSEQELHTVFVNWKELIMCNMKFLKALLVRKKMSETDKIEGIGDILIEQLPRFTPYTRFCSCLVNACRLLQDKVEKDADFKAFEKLCAGDSRLKQNLPLSSYLLKPLQRITKYPLIISGILKYTPEDHFDRINLECALEKSEDLCSEVNEGVGSQENSNRLEWLQERVNLDGLEENLVFNSQTNCVGHRKFLQHGTLHKHKSNKELKAFLFNDFLMLCRIQTGHFKSTSGHPIFNLNDNTQYTIYKKPIFLNEVIVKIPSDPDMNELLFHLSHIDRVYSFRAESKNERNNWVSAIHRASEGFIETERDRRSRASRARSLGDCEVARLVVTIIEGADLHASDPNGTSDPYCEVSMGSQEHKTKVIPKDVNPKWNSTMIFNVKDINEDVLCLTVFDRDFFSPNDFLGRTEISVASIAKEGFKPVTKRLLLHEVTTGEIVVTLELQNLKT